MKNSTLFSLTFQNLKQTPKLQEATLNYIKQTLQQN